MLQLHFKFIDFFWSSLFNKNKKIVLGHLSLSTAKNNILGGEGKQNRNEDIKMGRK